VDKFLKEEKSMRTLLVLLVLFALCASLGAQSRNYVLNPPRMFLNPPRIINSLSNGSADDVDTSDTFTVTSPNGGETWLVGSTHDVTWTHVGSNSANVDIYLTTDGGSNWVTLVGATPNDDSWSWTIADLSTSYPLTQCKVWIRDTADTSTTGGDMSDNFFTIDKTGFKKGMYALYLPACFSLDVAPNPFRNSTKISYSVKTAGNVSIKVFDITGKEIATLMNGHATVGSHSVVWKTGAKAGVYVCKLVANNSTLIRKITVLN